MWGVGVWCGAIDSRVDLIPSLPAIHSLPAMQSPVYRFLDAVPTFADKAEAAPACADWKGSSKLNPPKNEGFAVPTQVSELWGETGIGVVWRV